MYTALLITLRRILQPLDRIVTEHPDAVALAALVVSFIPRFNEAAQTYLNPDEVLYFQMSIPSGIRTLYQSALGTQHPALYVVLMHWLSKVGEHEVALRSVAIAAGTVFPWFLYRWVSLVWNRLAGLLALLLVAFAPHLISLSAQTRGYTLAFLGICACLYFQERALRESSSRWMIVSSAALCLGIVSEYYVAFFAAAAGVGFLLRAWKQAPSRRLWIAWAVGQACGVALYGFLFVTQIRPMLSSPMGDAENEGWLHGAFPWPGDNLAVFLASGAVKQFAWLFASISTGTLMTLPFVAGLWFLWKGKSPAERLPSRLVIALTATMFVLAAAAAVFHFHPFGRSRHTGFLGIFIAAVIAIALERVLRRRPGMLLPAALVLLPAWHFFAIEDQNNIAASRHQRRRMLAAIEHLRTRIPAGAAILMDGETRLLVDYYAGPRGSARVPRQQKAREWASGDYRLVSYRFSYQAIPQIADDLRQFRADYRLPSDNAVWLIDGGWSLFEYRNTPQDQAFRTGMENLGDVLWIVKVPPVLSAGAAP